MALPTLSDGLWAEIAPLLPRHRYHRKGGRPWLDDRVVFVGIVYILRTGIAWDDVPTKAFGCSGMTCWRRMREWERRNVWRRLHKVLLGRLNGAAVIDWSRAAVDSGSVAAPRGGGATGRNPTDRGKLGTKRHVVVDAQGIPLAVTLSGANEHDSRMLETTIDAIPALHRRNRRGRPRRRPEKLHGDKGSIIDAVVTPCVGATSSLASLVAASSRPSDWAAIDGWLSARWPGSMAFAAYASAMSVALRITSPSFTSLARSSAHDSSNSYAKRL